MEREDLYDHPDHQDVKHELVHALLSWRGDIADLKLLIDGTTAGSKPNRLNEKAEKVDISTCNYLDPCWTSERPSSREFRRFESDVSPGTRFRASR